MILKAGAISVSGGGLTLLESHTASASATLDFATRNATGQSGATFQSDYDDYLIEIVDIVPGTSETEFNLRFSTDGGSTFSTSTYEYVGIANSSGNVGISSSGLVSSGGTTEIKLFTLVDATQSYGVNGSVRFRNPLSASLNKSVEFQISAPLKSGATVRRYMSNGSGFWATTTAVNAIRFLFSSGNIASGTIRVYGLAK